MSAHLIVEYSTMKSSDTSNTKARQCKCVSSVAIALICDLEAEQSATATVVKSVEVLVNERGTACDGSRCDVAWTSSQVRVAFADDSNRLNEFVHIVWTAVVDVLFSDPSFRCTFGYEHPVDTVL